MNARDALARLPAFRRAQGVIGILCALSVVYVVSGPLPWQATLGDKEKVETYVAVYTRWAALANLLPLALLALTARWWMRPLACGPSVAGGGAPRWFWPVVGAAMLACAAMNAPRLAHGLWDDEEYTLRRIILGSYRITAEGEPKLREVPWTHTLWYYGKPNNHFLNSVAGRLSNTLWRAVARPAGLQFSEPALRLPAFLAGVLSVGAWALLVRTLGFSGGGALAAWLIALHPWHMRFVPELRGYAFVFLLLPLACLLAVRAMRDGGWRWWIAYGATQFAVFAAWPGTLLSLVVLNAGVALMIVRAGQDRSILAGRWLVVSGCAGMAALLLYLPCVGQLFGHLDDWDAKGLGAPWLANVGSRLLTGMPWKAPGGTLPEMAVLLAQHPVLYGGLVAGSLALVGAGIARCAAAGAPGRVVGAVILLPGPATYVLARLKDTYLFEWYLVVMAPGLMALGAVGLGGILAVLGVRRPAWAVAGGLMVAVYFALATQAARWRLISQPVQFTRDSVQTIRPTLDPHDPRNRRILTVATLATPEIYDPNIRRVKSGAELEELLLAADQTGFPLFINHGYAAMLAEQIPSVAALVRRPDLFEKTAEFPGIEPMFDREILRYRPGSFVGPAGGRDADSSGAGVP